jgi:hypothetical protein
MIIMATTHHIGRHMVMSYHSPAPVQWHSHDYSSSERDVEFWEYQIARWIDNRYRLDVGNRLTKRGALFRPRRAKVRANHEKFAKKFS